MAPLLSLSLLALPAFLPADIRARNVTVQNVTIPQIFPTPGGDGAGIWTDAYTKAKNLVSQMTLEEMNSLTHGFSTTTNGCSGISGSVERLGFPGFCLQDAGNGVRNTDGVSSFAPGISIEASWNSTLAYNRAKFMGAEFKTKGANVALGPIVGPLGRIAKGGRNWEGMTNDPYLAGILGAETVKGLQESVIACVKHYIGNKQETHRTAYLNPAASSNIKDSPIHELYLWPFQDLVQAGAGSIMCSYNKLNGTDGCENSKTLNGLLKDELNFQGFVVTDWGAQHSGLASAKGGLDMAMRSSADWANGSLAAAARNGSLDQTRLQDMATRIVAAWYLVRQDADDYPELGIGMPSSLIAPHKYVNAKDPAAVPQILQQAIESHVLVKNVNNVLPLTKPDVISIFGYDATQKVNYGPQFVGATPNSTGTNFFGLNYQDIGAPADLFTKYFISGDPWPSAPEIQLGTLYTGGGCGSNTAAYLRSPYDAIATQATEDGTTLFHDFNLTSPLVVTSTSACLVFINEYASEGWDRPSLAHRPSDELVVNVANRCSNTIVIIHNAGVRLVDRFVLHPNVTGILFAHFPGQEAGSAVADILYGKISPSGRLPYIVAKSDSDYGALLDPCNTIDFQCPFTEGELIDYRGFLHSNKTPRYEFGFGLTYSKFTYSDLSVNVAPRTPVMSKTGRKDTGGLVELFEEVGTVTATIKNTGKVPVAEVAQLYLHIPGAPTKQLRGFDKTYIQPGESAMANFSLRRKDVSRWDVVAQKWIVPEGGFQVEVGASVTDVRLTGSF